MPRRALLSCLAALSILGIGADANAEAKAAEQQAPASAIPGPTWYAQALSRGGAGLNVTHFWSKGASMRAETVIAGHRIVTIVRGRTYFAYDRNLRNGLAIERAPAAMAVDDVNRRPFGNEGNAIVRQGAEKVGEENILGRTCDVLRVTDRRGRREVWVTQDAARLPIKMEIYHRRSGTEQYTDYLNWQTGLPIPDEFFEPEDNIIFARFTNDEYVRKTALEGPQGPVPILYGDLLQGSR